MRLIDADALKKHYAWWEDERQSLFDSIVDQQPTVDAVPVIRCKDCKHYGGEIKGCNHDDAMIIATADDFCSLAERREE